MQVTDHNGKEVPMTRQFEAFSNGLGRWTFTLEADADLKEAQRVAPTPLSKGYALVATVIGPRQFTLEAKPTGEPIEPEAPAGDPLNALSDVDLKTKCAEKGVKYDPNPKKFDRFKALAELREKLKT